MGTLTGFLLARIAEDEAWAVKIGSYVDPHTRVSIHLSRTEGAVTTSERVWAVTHTRVLAECEAKRRIVEHCERDHLALSPGDPYVLALLALPYADHPDYLLCWA